MTVSNSEVDPPLEPTAQGSDAPSSDATTASPLTSPETKEEDSKAMTQKEEISDRKVSDSIDETTSTAVEETSNDDELVFVSKTAPGEDDKESEPTPQEPIVTESTNGDSPKTQKSVSVQDSVEDKLDTSVDPPATCTASKSMDGTSENGVETTTPAEETPGATGVATDEAFAVSSEEQERLRMVEEMHIGTASEILFAPPSQEASSSLGGAGVWDNLRWMSLSGSRKVVFSRVVFRRVKEQTTIIMWKSPVRITFPARLLVLYEHPQILLVLRRAQDLDELSNYTAVDYSSVDQSNNNNSHQDPVQQILQHYWIAESVVDLTTCKIRLSPVTTNYASQVIEKIQHDRELSCFEIMTPSDTSICLSAVQIRPPSKSKQEISFTDSGAFMEITSTENALIHALCQAHGVGNHEDATLRHQVILGTLHAYVLSGNTKALEEALLRTWEHANKKGDANDMGEPIQNRTLPERIIDATDDNGHPPLYYACQQNMNDAIALLVRYGASLDYTTSLSKDSLLHICARNRNYKGLKTLLSEESRPRRPGVSVNAVNSMGQTPLYTALVSGKLNSKDLESCIHELKAKKGTIFGTREGPRSGLRHPIVVLAMAHRPEDLAVLLQFLQLGFPLTGNMDIMPQYGSSRKGESLAALYGYPLHRLLASLYMKVVHATVGVSNTWNGNKPSEHPMVKCLGLLLQCGFESNERLEEVTCDDSDDPEILLGLFAGFAPIQILAATALALEKIGPDLPECTYGELDAVLSQLCEVLIQTGGARISLEPPPLQRKRGVNNGKTGTPSPQKSSQKSLQETSTGLTAEVDRSNLKIDSNDHILHLLGGEERLKKAQIRYSEMGSAMCDPSWAPLLLDEGTSVIEDSDAPGGSSDKSCAICWKVFGTLMNRKHRCRVTWRHVCDECSTKRVLVNGKEYRVSDGQFVRTTSQMESKASATTFSSRQRAKGTFSRQSSSSSASGMDSARSASRASARRQRLEAEDKANRDSLFGGDVMEQAKNMLFGSTAEDNEEPADSRGGLMNSLGETRNALLERGDKLSSLSDKSAQMVSASEDFAKMVSASTRPFCRFCDGRQNLFWTNDMRGTLVIRLLNFENRANEDCSGDTLGRVSSCENPLKEELVPLLNAAVVVQASAYVKSIAVYTFSISSVFIYA